jgi:hypothetical protein
MHYPGTGRKICDCHHGFGDSVVTGIITTSGRFPRSSRRLLNWYVRMNEELAMKYGLSVEREDRDMLSEFGTHS